MPSVCCGSWVIRILRLSRPGAGDDVPAKRIDLVGQQFGFLTVKGFVGMAKRHALYFCECRCGRLVTMRGTDLVSTRVRRCGKSCTYERPQFYPTFRIISDGSKI
jgi:hypothetical protein